MAYSSRIVQKASDISDGKDSLKTGVRITFSFDSWSERLCCLRFFLRSAIAALLNKELEQIFYDEDFGKITKNMTKVPQKRERQEA
ncbi:hypothetical protein L5V96_003755 [Salmonella enterica]|nr:hypothetical protein [Salmonella enterica]EFP4971360.1 hypothetical protein [Salmonella enterica]EIU6612772.1 hypothetical protein [Salmonella enterica]